MISACWKDKIQRTSGTNTEKVIGSSSKISTRLNGSTVDLLDDVIDFEATSMCSEIASHFKDAKSLESASELLELGTKSDTNVEKRNEWTSVDRDSDDRLGHWSRSSGLLL